MLILAIDDEPKMLRLLHNAIEEAVPSARIRDFPLGSHALRAIEEERLRPSVIFTDIQMPQLNGLELAMRLKELVPDAKIVFVTGHDEYAVDAWRLHASGYVMKPVDAQRIREEMDNVAASRSDLSEKLVVRCFGYFEVLWHDEPLPFARHKTKELFAWLVDRRGTTAQAEEVIEALYENAGQQDMKRAKQNLRNLVNDLKTSLKRVGMEDVVIRRGSTLAIRPERLECDYYRMLQGDMDAENRFRGQYMEQYSWAEITKGNLHFGSGFY